jgi:hypothetical protein
MSDEIVWDPWDPAEVARRLAGVTAPWYVAAGWALDLWHGRQTRPHHDIEIAVPAGAFDQVREALPGYVLEPVGSGRRWPLGDDTLRVTHQTWVREPDTGVYRLDVFREPHDGDIWICRRDPRIRLPYAWIVHRTADGIPYLAPEIVLLFKAKATRPHDEADLDRALPRLDDRRRAWLRWAVGRVHPGHPWLDRIPSGPDPARPGRHDHAH